MQATTAAGSSSSVLGVIKALILLSWISTIVLDFIAIVTSTLAAMATEAAAGVQEQLAAVSAAETFRSALLLLLNAN